MLQLTTRDSDHRVFVIWDFIRRYDVGRRELGTTIGAREAIAEHNRLPRVGFAELRVGDGLGLQTLPCDDIERRHGQFHLGNDLGHISVIPVQSDALREFDGDFSVFAHLTRRSNRRTHPLHLTVNVRHGAILFIQR